MKIIACFKVSPESQDIQTRPDRTLSLDRAVWKIGAYDLNAIEAARQLGDQMAATVTGLSAGGPDLASPKLTKDALSRGLDELSLVTDPALPAADTYQTAEILARAIAQTEDAQVVFVGAGSADGYNQQVGNILGGLLGWSTLNAVHAVTPAGDHLVVERLLEDAVEIVEVTLPAVLSLTSSANTPRIAGMKDILAAGKRPVTTLDVGAPVAAGAELISELAPEQVDRRHVVIPGPAAEAAATLATYLNTL
ncbi:MAG: hypothetical protein LBI33_01895 [Propionibacteriaceae bacterium]|jgi:electron transfer flavoprotein beta subunit|nr:hypothetical protein [Propionibacteriaceae bacterium]